MPRRLPGGLALQHLEPVRGHEQRPRGLVQPVIGAADALHQALYLQDEWDPGPNWANF